MAGAMRKMAVYLGLVEDDQYDDVNGYAAQEDARDRSDARDRGDDRVGATSDRHATRGAREPLNAADGLRVTETEDDLGRRRLPNDRPTRDWRTETVHMEPVGAAHPAGSRTKPAARPVRASEGLKITTLHPRSYNEARRIGEEFRAGTPVIINLTELDDNEAKRIVDFAAGLVFGLRGSIERVTNKVFMLSPANVQVGADAARAQLEQDGLAAKR